MRKKSVVEWCKYIDTDSTQCNYLHYVITLILLSKEHFIKLINVIFTIYIWEQNINKRFPNLF